MKTEVGAASTRVLLVAITATFAFGCESGSRFPPSDLSFEEFCPRWQAQLIALNARCNDIPESVPRVDVCARQAASLAAHRLGFDRSVAAPCLRDWQALSCAAFRNRAVPACEGLEPPQVDEGGVCTDDAECKGVDLFCARPPPGVCPGVCQPRVAVDGGVQAAPLYPGDACSGTDAVCVPFASCGAAGTCVRLPIAGEACGQSGDQYLGCLGAWCDGAPGGAPGICRAQLPVGAACTADLQCAGAETVCTNQICGVAVCGS